MNQKPIIILILLCLFTINVSAQKKKAKSTRPTAAEKNASNIIGYTNTIIDLSNAYSKSYKHYEHMIFMAESEMRSVKSKNNRFPTKGLSNSDTSAVDKSLYANYAAKLKLAPATFTGKADILAAVKNADASVQNLYKYSRALNRYFVDKEYEKDSEGYPGYDALVDSINANVARTRRAWDMAARVASKAGSEAENVILKRSPMGEFIIPMKADLALMRELVEDVFSDDENIDWNAISERSVAMKTAFDKVKDGQGKNMNKITSHAKKSEFTGFYNSGIRFAEGVELLAKVMNDAKSSDDYKERTFKEVSSRYSDMIKSYNYFATEQY